jgi:hypothetical protein
MKESSIDMILNGTSDQDDASIIRDLGMNSQNKVVRVSYIVDKLIFH